ncbi:beta-glucosidase BglX [Ascidiimonas aurantiaca]|uniref:beta-glucosidase BglX n=1 Tax=Ascidiimonas aurantiaca TaxID=1685432 RepID=UPI0030EF555F
MNYKKVYTLLLFSIALLLTVSCKKVPAGNATTSLLDQRVDSVLALMTLKEKIGQMNQYNGFWDATGPVPEEGDAAGKYEDLRNGRVGSMLNVRGVEQVRAVQKIAVEETRLGIPLIIGFDAIHGYSTISPIPLAEAASWDMEAIQKSAAVSAAETAAMGINWTFAPMVDISRDPRWGRVMEGAGEDPYLGSRIAEARVKGFQGDDLAAVNTIAACAKHFAGYGFSEAGRDYNTVDIGTSTLYNVVFPPFEAASNAGVRTFMNAFNVLEGIPATGHTFLQREILKKEWGFTGFIVSDWGSIGEMIPHGYAANGRDAAYKAITAGSDMDMESALYLEHLEDLVNEGLVHESLIDDAVRRILRLKFELGLFDDPYRYCDEQREATVPGSREHLEAVEDMAKKSIVLLKNEDKLLPLPKEGLKIALIGPLADDKNSPLGSWRLAAEDHTASSVKEGLELYGNHILNYAVGAKLTLGKPAFVFETKVNTTDRSGFSEAINVARDADVVVMVLGENGYQSGEGRSVTSLDLPGLQQELLEAVYNVNKKIVLVLMNGRPLTINWADENIPAIVEAWHLGTRSGHAIAQVLYGEYNPGGKLPMTFPRTVGQIPLYYNHKNTGRPLVPGPDLVFWSHYTDEENTPLYAFGHGLSYTTFQYHNLQLSNPGFSGDERLEISVEVTNTGERAGREVVQLYLRDLVASVTRPVKELKGFETVNLQPGETKKVTFTIDKETISFYNAQQQKRAESGEFAVYVGGSSVTVLESLFTYQE